MLKAVPGLLALLLSPGVPLAHACRQAGPELTVVEVEGQPLAENARRLAQALEYLGTPLPPDVARALETACAARDARAIQRVLDPRVVVAIAISPEERVKARRGPGAAELQQTGYVPVLLKIHNESTVTKALRVTSPQAGPIVSGRRTGEEPADPTRFLDVEVFGDAPMTPHLSGLELEYALALVASSEAGRREATLVFDIGQGTQDLGFRAEVPVLFEVRPAVEVRLEVLDADGEPTVGRFTFRDALGRVYPPRAKRLAPDFFFQDQIYRADGSSVRLPPGELVMEYGRGPEYALRTRTVTVPSGGEPVIRVELERWIDPRARGFYSGDHHIHAAGCAHYSEPTEGVLAEDMFLHVKGEGLHVGCLLTWGPCFRFQSQFFTPESHPISEPFTVLKYDLEISGFGSQALGHACLLNLTDQVYPGSEGTEGWPTWTTPLFRWARAQGAFTGYAHSASGLQVVPQNAARRLLTALDGNADERLSPAEAAAGLLPFEFRAGDHNQDGLLGPGELAHNIEQATRELPNLCIPELNGIGAQEIFVTVPQGLCDFIGGMNTQRLAEWNCWYHLMNCGFPLKISGETDFPCISGSRVGEGRVYVQLGAVEALRFPAWARGLAEGRSYVSDGYAHALAFTVGGKALGDTLELAQPGPVAVRAEVAFARELPLGTATGGELPDSDVRRVELVVNGRVAAAQEVPADGRVHALAFEVTLARSSWVALRSYPQLHTNPVTVRVAGQPIRASRKSALWAIGCVEQLWAARGESIAESERAEAERTFRAQVEVYRRIAAEAEEGS
ncbi:MAG TPA: CehA/McbA family metallohydrolase [Planctomycetota bacterium]